MTAKLYALPTGQNNPRLVLARRLAYLETQSGAERYAELNALLQEFNVERSVKQNDKAR